MNPHDSYRDPGLTPPKWLPPDALARWRDRLLASPRFQRAAARWWPTRWIARRRARALFDLVAGFVYSQVLAALVRLDAFDRLAREPLSAEAFARDAALPAEAAQRLLDAAVSLRLLERRSGARYGLGTLGAPLAGRGGTATAVRAMVEHHRELYEDLADPLALLRGAAGRTRLGTVWPYAGDAQPAALDALQVRRYSMLMTASQPLVADEILGALPLRGHRCLLDVGGGEGAFLAQAAARAPRLRLMLFDLPAVAARARVQLAQAGLAARAEVHAGDFRRDPLPAGADLVTLIRVVHDHPDDIALALLRAVHAALPQRGTLLVAEPMAGTRGAEPVADAYFGLYLLAMGSGRPRSRDALAALMRSAGFDAIRELHNPLPLQTRMLVGRKA